MIEFRTLNKLTASLVEPLFTGGIARNYHLTQNRDSVLQNSDIDVVVEDIAAVRESVNNDFFIAHYHPERGAGKLVIQLADKESYRVRIGRGKTRVPQTIHAMSAVAVHGCIIFRYLHAVEPSFDELSAD